MADQYKWMDRAINLTLAKAAHLWAGLPFPPDNKVEDPAAKEIFLALKSELYERKAFGPGVFPKGHHVVDSALLQEIAEVWDERPTFLYPNERTPVTREKGEPHPDTLKQWHADHEQVEEALSKGANSRRQAAKEVAKKTGRSAETIARNDREYRERVRKRGKSGSKK